MKEVYCDRLTRTPVSAVKRHHYLLIPVHQEVVGTQLEHHQTSEQLQRVFALVSLLRLVEADGDDAGAGSPRPSGGTLGLRRDILLAATAAAAPVGVRLCRRGRGAGGPGSPGEDQTLKRAAPRPCQG